MKQIRINFDDSEWSSIELLMQEYRISTPQKLLRTLVSHEIIRGSKARMRAGKPGGTSASAPGAKRTNIHERMRELEAMNDEDLTAALDEKGCLAELRTFPEDSVRVETTGIGDRIIRVTSKQGGTDDSMPLGMMLTRWKNQRMF